MLKRLLWAPLVLVGLGGCVVHPAGGVYAPARAPVYVAPRPYYAPAPRPVYVAPAPRRVWVPRQCNRYGRCWGGYWR
jgi:hypothetical protein